MKKISILFISFLFSLFSVFAMPGFESFIKDNSGEFVYYRDYSFPRESYIGILYYSEDSIQIRYYAPQDNVKMLPEKEISILFSINSKADYLEFTGELVLSMILPDTDDVDIVNYLHDILYEFSSRRGKEYDISSSSKNYVKDNHFIKTGVHSTQNYDQFGGRVTVIFDPLIPVFNVKTILDGKGETVLSCVTFGLLNNSDDSLFDDFKGFAETTTKDSAKKKSYIIKNQKPVEYTTNSVQTVSLDSNWTQAMENLWLCGNESLLTINYLPHINDLDQNEYDLTILRKLLLSSNGSYTNLQTLEITKDEKTDSYKIYQTSYQPSTFNTIINKRIITRDKKELGFYYFSLTVFEDFYNLNRSFYDKVQKSYKVKN